MAVRFELPDDHSHVALVTIDRPERANALDPPTLRELAASWERIAGDPEIRCAVVTGRGDRVCCSGMDMKATIPEAQRLARGERVSPEVFEGLRAVSTALLAGFDLATPLVCAINGHARAGGFDLSLQVGLLLAGGRVVEAGVPLRPALELVEEVEHHLGQREAEVELDPLG